MGAPTLGERMAIGRLVVRSVSATASSRIAALPLIRRSRIGSRVDGFLLVPPDMRAADPSLLDEIAAGQMGLGGVVLDIGGGSPFAISDPDPSWARELNGFAWLGGLRLAGGEHAVAVARRLVADWCRRNRTAAGGRGTAGEPLVHARRVISWLAAAGFLLEDADAAFYRSFTRALAAELRALDGISRRIPPGYGRLACLMALTLACLAVEGHERGLKRIEARLMAELARQLLADGGHISRNPDIVVEVLLDLLPIRQCYAARGLAMPAALPPAVERMLEFLHMMMAGRGALARFNGAGQGRPDDLATVVTLDHAGHRPRTRAPGASGYARLERAGTVVIVDCGAPPPLVHGARAHAGALSFELAHAGESVIVNAGAPSRALRRARADARASASHSTLVLDEQSSARLLRSRHLESLIGGPALAGIDTVTAALTEGPGGVELVASHDGYLSRFGLIHERRLALSADGRVLEGTDTLRPPHGALRLAHDLPFAIHFHLPVETAARPLPENAILIEPADGRPWRLWASGGRLALEAGTDYTLSVGPASARQAVVRASTPGETVVTWRLEQM